VARVEYDLGQGLPKWETTGEMVAGLSGHATWESIKLRFREVCITLRNLRHNLCVSLLDLLR